MQRDFLKRDTQADLVIDGTQTETVNWDRLKNRQVKLSRCGYMGARNQKKRKQKAKSRKKESRKGERGREKDQDVSKNVWE